LNRQGCPHAANAGPDGAAANVSKPRERKGKPKVADDPVAWLDGMVEVLVSVEFTAKLWSLHHIPGYRIS
jgi:hypothetical protein